jgi:hypothetical protein
MKALHYHSCPLINGDHTGYEEILHHFPLSIPTQQDYWKMDTEGPLYNCNIQH